MRVKKRGVPKCSQRKNAIKKAPEKAPKSQKNTRKSGVFGAATQIRTGDLILTNRLETLTGSICSSQLILKNQVIPTVCGFLITDLL